MDVLDAIQGRRSIRAFNGRNISSEELMTILDAGRRAPSAGNIQPWEFVVIRDPARKKALAQAALNQSFIAEAPAVVVVCANLIRSAAGYGGRGANLYCLQDTAAAVQNMLLASHGMGLGACWVGAFDERRVAQLIDAPEEIRPIAIVPIGHPDERPTARRSRSLEEVVHYESL